MPQRTVYILAPHTAICDVMRQVLQELTEVRVVGDTTEPASDLTVILRAAPDVALIAAQVGGFPMLPRIREIQARLPDTLAIVAADGFDPALAVALVEAGIRGYVVWSEMSLETLHHFLAFELDCREALPLSLDAARAMLGALQQGAGSLTLREREVLALIAGGASNLVIAARLGISLATVRSHVSHLLAKMGGKTRAELVALAHQHGVV